MKTIVIAAVCLFAGLAGGCAGNGAESVSASVSGPGAITLDGDFSDWPSGVSAWADAEAVYVRLPASHGWPLQAARESLALAIDLDGDRRTGREGADVEVLFSPPSDREPGAFRGGVVGRVFDAAGSARDVGQSALDVVALPTFAAPEYEIRIGRASPAVRGLASDGGRIVVCAERRDVTGRALAPAWTVAVDAPSASARLAAGPPLARKSPGELRIAAYNVLWNGPFKRPEAFTRVMRAVDADIWLFQEFDERTNEQPLNAPEAVASWLRERVGGEWNVVRGEERGVVIASRLPMAAVVRSLSVGVDSDAGTAMTQDVRFVAALVDSPLGPLLACSTHLKCCGSSDGWEDLRRTLEAAAINASVRSQIKDLKPASTIIGGDYNLVGSRRPLETMITGIDADGSDLAVAPLAVWGSGDTVTFVDERGAFPPGRLDYISVGDANTEIVRSFTLDTARLSDAALRAMGLERGDTAASDHLPSVVDIRARGGPR